MLFANAVPLVAQTKEPQRFRPPVHVFPSRPKPVLQAAVAESLYGEPTQIPATHSVAIEQEDESQIPAENAVFRQAPSNGPRAKTPSSLVSDDVEASPMLSAPIDDPFGDRGIHLRTEHAGTSTNSGLRSSKGRAQSAGHRRQEGAAGQQEIDDPAQEQDPAEQIQEATCDEYRRDLLNQPITVLDINISAPRPGEESQGPAMRAVSRDWKDRYGNVLAHGSLIEISRGYAIVGTDAGQQSFSLARLGDEELAAIAAIWRLPNECTLGDLYAAERCWVPQTYTWKASDLCHKPLYFEDEQLERYGHSAGPVLQPLKSTAHFFVGLATVPYHMGIHPANECLYALGFYRPGNCAPWLCDACPISLNGAAKEALFVTSAAFILP